ncbi:MAG: MFS transporter [Myxococcota bacterium]
MEPSNPSTPEALRNSVHARNVAGGIVGNVIEWYDFALFGFLAPVLSELFFPADDLLAGLIKTYGIFAAGYVMRPIGGVLFGHIGDRIGRKRALELSVAMMTLPTVALGLMPTEASIGVWAPVGLIALRLIQGLSVGGEVIGSMIFLGEIAPPGRRGLYCSGGGTGVILGMLLGSAAAAGLDGFLDRESLLAFGWRIPFLLGLVLGGLGIWIRMGMTETAVFELGQRARTPDRAPIVEILRHYRLLVFKLFTAMVLFAAAFYVIFIWVPVYLTQIMKPPETQALLFNTIAMLLLMGFLPMAGALSDRFGRRVILLLATLGFVVLSVPLFVGLHSGSWWVVLTVQIGFAYLMSFIQGTIPATLVEMFATRVRYTGIALAYNIVFALFGGTAPLVCTWLMQQTGDPFSPAYYIVVLGVVSFAATLSLRFPTSTRINLRA